MEEEDFDELGNWNQSRAEERQEVVVVSFFIARVCVSFRSKIILLDTLKSYSQSEF